MTDFLMLQRIHRMIKELPRPRLLFRKGVTAEGFFRPYMSFSEYTKARIFGSFDEITPVTVRFASMLGSPGTADTARNIKGMNVKFHSGDGDYDMICHSIPVFFIDEAEKFFDMADAFTKRYSFDGINTRRFWEFIVENPEAAHCALRLFSKEGLSGSYIGMKWYSADTCVWENAAGGRYLVRYRWLPVVEDREGSRGSDKALDRLSAEFMAGFDSDRAVDDLEAAVKSGAFPQYELYVQMRGYHGENIAEITKRTVLWDEETVPAVAAGIMKLTSVPDGALSRRDTTSFVPENTVEGIAWRGDGLGDIINYMYRVEELERGGLE